MELFQTPAPPQSSNTPLASKLAPKEWNEFIGQDHLVSINKPLRRAIDAGRITSSIFFGPPGTGKTALARLAASKSEAVVSYLNAVTAGVGDIRRVVQKAIEIKQIQNKGTLLIVDEIHHFNKSQQDALLPDVERGNITLIGLTTENPHFYVNSALLSRSTTYEFFPLKKEDLIKIFDKAVNDSKRGLGGKSVEFSDEAKNHFLNSTDGDARRLLNDLELAVLTTPPQPDGKVKISLKDAEESSQKRAIRYDKKGDEHYDTISAFIKSLRGSNPDAAIYWMAKMLVAGEDPRFVARRMMIFASEDIGNADPNAITLATSVARSVEMIGMPEARIPLGQAAAYLASAPKSNASYLAINKAMEEVRKGPVREVPNHLKDATMDSESRGHGKGYLYPHDFPGHQVEQVYMPEPKTFYDPSDQGLEAEIKKRLETWRRK